MKSYKFTDSNMRCKGFQFEIGKTYRIPDEHDLEMCKTGFHSSPKAIAALKYYNVANSRLFEVDVNESIGDEGDKICSREITFVRELTLYEALRVLNEFELRENTNRGFGNYGNYNYGNDNHGNSNEGNYNQGNDNYGNGNNGNDNYGNGNNGNGIKCTTISF